MYPCENSQKDTAMQNPDNERGNIKKESVKGKQKAFADFPAHRHTHISERAWIEQQA
uniref:Uncharacterized protein n=1 Tax=Anguilla anguilla TaxID=7936 RepID=A0A0E9VW58_ANGAN